MVIPKDHVLVTPSQALPLSREINPVFRFTMNLLQTCLCLLAFLTVLLFPLPCQPVTALTNGKEVFS